MDLINGALEFAINAHMNQLRKGSNLPYILHPMEAATIVSSITFDPAVIAAALLHDVVEDTGVTIDDIEAQFGSRVAELVSAETENKREGIPPASTWRVRKEEAIKHIAECGDRDVKIVCLGDKLSNMRSMCRDYALIGDALWQRFHQKDPRQHEWYYRSMAECMSELKDYPAWKEFNWLINQLFGKI